MFLSGMHVAETHKPPYVCATAQRRKSPLATEPLSAPANAGRDANSSSYQIRNSQPGWSFTHCSFKLSKSQLAHSIEVSTRWITRGNFSRKVRARNAVGSVEVAV